MPKRSKEDTEITIQKIMDAVVDQLLRLGYDKCRIRRESADRCIAYRYQPPFPKKTDFTAALDGRIFKMFIEHLEFEKGLDAFSQSWIKALEDSEFLAILRLLFHHIVTSESAHEFAANGIDRLYKMVESQFGSGGDKELEWLIGRSLIQMSK